MDFLEKLAKEFIVPGKNDYSDYCFVFPTRRACLYFKKKFADAITHPVWSPVVLPVEEFLGTLTNKKIADEIHLISELYLVYKNYFPEETFDKFYAWGEVLLRDFDEIDRYLIDSKLIFSNVKDYKEIQLLFQPEEEDLKTLKDFWQGFSDKELTYLRQEFYKTWQVLPSIYADFNQSLSQTNFCYEGAAYKEIAEKIIKGEINFHYKKIIFAGFYALSKAEQIIFDYLHNAGIAEIIRDIDNYYCNPAFETYRFIKDLPPQSKWRSDDLLTTGKIIEMAGVPLLAGQAKYMGQKLQQLFNKENFIPENTAVVLPDTNLLFPVLNSIPPEVESINVTMGYPLKDTSYSKLIAVLSSLQQHATDESNTRFYHKDVNNVLHNPVIRNIARKQISEWHYVFKKHGWIFISGEELLKTLPAHFNVIFKKINSAEEIIPYLRELFFMIAQEEPADELQPDFISAIISQLNKFENSIYNHLHLFDQPTLWLAIQEVANSCRIPFEGESTNGLQVMGFLETRNLDFENLIILSCNENLLPPASRSNSFIPYPIRKGFGLPSHEEKDAISAYHFYRLLQRAKNITLIYDTELKSVIGGEKSRFLLQLEHELCKKNPNIQLNKKIVSTPIRREKVFNVEVEKTDGVMNLLSRFTDKGTTPFEKKLSASALINYLNCPMQFYLRYVAKVEELTGPDEHLDAIPFGKVLHKAIEILYTQKDIIHAEEARVAEMILAAVEAAIANEFTNPQDVIKGKNILLRDVIIELLNSIIKNDRKTKDLTIKDLEATLTYNFKLENDTSVGLHGVADRIDMAENILRIIDYKTGFVYINKSLDIEKLFTDMKFKAVFQAFYYAYLYKKMHEGSAVKAGIYNLPKANSGINFLSNDSVLTDAQLKEFEQHLQLLLHEIFDSGTAFKQTDDETRCAWCAYTDICHR